MLIMANVLDPQCKLSFVTWCFSILCDAKKVDELRVNIKELLKFFESYGGKSNSNRGKRNSAMYEVLVVGMGHLIILHSLER